MMSISLNYINSFWLFRKCKSMFLYEITHRYLKNHYQFSNTLKTKDRKTKGNYDILTKGKFHKIERLKFSFNVGNSSWWEKGNVAKEGTQNETLTHSFYFRGNLFPILPTFSNAFLHILTWFLQINQTLLLVASCILHYSLIVIIR